MFTFLITQPFSEAELFFKELDKETMILLNIFSNKGQNKDQDDKSKQRKVWCMFLMHH